MSGQTLPADIPRRRFSKAKAHPLQVGHLRSLWRSSRQRSWRASPSDRQLARPDRSEIISIEHNVATPRPCHNIEKRRVLPRHDETPFATVYSRRCARQYKHQREHLRDAESTNGAETETTHQADDTARLHKPFPSSTNHQWPASRSINLTPSTTYTRARDGQRDRELVP